MNHDAVFYGVIICVAGAAAVAGYLLYVIYKKATAGENDGK